MEKTSSIYIAGHSGLAGSAIMKAFLKAGCYTNVFGFKHSELDLTNQHSVERIFGIHRPEYVVLCAARVGGIMANNRYSAEFIYSNLQIQTNVIHACHLFGVKRLIFLGSSCIYPKMATQPMNEEQFLSGYLEPTNIAYSTAKIAGIEMCRAYNKQYGTDFISVMPTNLYGPHDNYHPINSHVLPGLLHKFHMAKEQKQPVMKCWGTGSPQREFLYSEDLGEAIRILLETPVVSHDLINIGSGHEVTIKELSELIKAVVGYEGAIEWDTSVPDGTPRKVLDCEKILSYNWKPKVSLEEGLKLTYDDFIKNYDTLRK